MKMNWKYQLVLQFPFDGINDYDRMIALEEALTTELGKTALVDGHDAGSGEMNIFIHTNEPEEIAARIVSMHGSDSMFSQMKAAYRGFDSDDFMTVWPKDFEGTFTMK